MNIEKVKNYNQKILALIGTVIFLFALVGLISLIYVLIDDAIREKRYRTAQDGILSEEKIEQLQTEKKRLQVVSYFNPSLVDSLNLIYTIPVGQKTLQNPEEIEEVSIGLGSGLNKKYDSRYSSSSYGNYNNVLIYNAKTNQTQKLFEKRLNFGRIRTEFFDDEVLLLIEAASKDTYRDGVINLKDYKTLYVYAIYQKQMHHIELEYTDIENVSFIEGTKDMLILFGVDKNKDGRYTEYQEPSILKRYDFKTQKLIDVVQDKMNNELQQTLEGTK